MPPKVTSAGWPRLVVASLRFIVLAECTNAWRMRELAGDRERADDRQRNLGWHFVCAGGGRSRLFRSVLHVMMGQHILRLMGRVLGPLRTTLCIPDDQDPGGLCKRCCFPSRSIFLPRLPDCR